MKTVKFILLLIFAILQAAAQQTLFNGSFEDTLLVAPPGVNGARPQGWRMGTFGAKLSPDAMSGKFAAAIWNWYYYGKGTLINGSNTSNASYNAGTPISFRPDKLTGNFKYIAGNNGGASDSAIVHVSLVKFNPATYLRDTLGSGQHKFPLTSTYQPFQVNITYSTSTQPDTIVVEFQSSIRGFCDANSDGNCLYLYVDDLAVVNSVTGIGEPIQLAARGVYPNPASDRLHVDGIDNAEEILLISSTGQLIRDLKMVDHSLDISTIPEGLYILRIGSSGRTERFVKNQ